MNKKRPGTIAVNSFNHKSFLLALLIFLLSSIMLQGCAYRLGARAFSLKEKIVEPNSETCTEGQEKAERKTISQESLEARVTQEPSDTEPVLELSVIRHVTKKKMIKKSYECEKMVLWKPQGSYIYDPIEFGMYSTLLTYRNTAQREEKNLADWIFLYTGWPFAGVDYFTFGLWGVSGGPIVDMIIPAWEDERCKTIRFAKKSDFCEMGAITFLALGTGLPVCLFRSEVTVSGNVTEDFTMADARTLTSSEREIFTKQGDWETEDIVKEDLPLSGSLVARLKSQDSPSIECNFDENGMARIDLEPFITEQNRPTELDLFMPADDVTPKASVAFNWKEGVKLHEEPQLLQESEEVKVEELGESEKPQESEMAGLKKWGSCEDYVFTFTSEGDLKDSVFAKVLSNNAPVYKGENSSEMLKSVAFNKNVFITQVKGSRALLASYLHRAPLGWTELSYLLCSNNPLRSELNYEMKFFVHTENDESVNAYSSEAHIECVGNCEALTRKEGYYIFAENSESYLLNDSDRVTPETDITGWVTKDKGTLWDTLLGGRIQDNSKPLCIYYSISDARKKENCHSPLPLSQFQEGDSSARLLIVKKSEDFYTVVIPQTLTGRERTITGYIPVDVDIVEEFRLTDKELDRWIQFLKKIDIQHIKEDKNFHQIFVQIVKQALVEVTDQPDIDYTLKVGQILRHHGQIPVRDDSPIFSYSLNELKDAHLFPLCALKRAKRWLHYLKEILMILRSGTHRPDPRIIINFYNNECPSAQNIPFIEGPVQQVPRGSLSSDKVFWVPRDFLP